MTSEEYQIAVIESINNISIKMDNLTLSIYVLSVIVGAFFVYMVVHNMIKRR